jgi:RimJ/RimL family protein N-acetyltransferase
MDEAQFNALHIPALERNEVRHNLLLGLMLQPSPDPAGETRRWTLGRPGACALQTKAKRSIILGDLDESACHALAGAVYGSVFAGAVGPESTAHWFVARSTELGLSFRDPEPLMIHELREPPLYPGADGRARRATADDFGLIFEWMTAFRAEAVPNDPPVTEENVARKVKERVILLWETGCEVVSMASVNRETRNVAAIGPVYTPAIFRGRGYAGSVTAALTDHIFASGKTAACLYTDLHNPYSNRCYAKIGFKPVCPSWHYHRIEPRAEVTGAAP